MGRTTIWEERLNEGKFRLFNIRLDQLQGRDGFPSGVGYVSTVFRRRRSAVHHERAVFHHAARSWHKRRQALWLLRSTDDLFLRGFRCGTTIVFRRSRVTTLAGNDRLRRVLNAEIGGDNGAATAEEAPAGHPDGDADR